MFSVSNGEKQKDQIKQSEGSQEVLDTVEEVEELEREYQARAKKAVEDWKSYEDRISADEEVIFGDLDEDEEVMVVVSQRDKNPGDPSQLALLKIRHADEDNLGVEVYTRSFKFKRESSGGSVSGIVDLDNYEKFLDSFSSEVSAASYIHRELPNGGELRFLDRKGDLLGSVSESEFPMEDFRTKKVRVTRVPTRTHHTIYEENQGEITVSTGEDYTILEDISHDILPEGFKKADEAWIVAAKKNASE